VKAHDIIYAFDVFDFDAEFFEKKGASVGILLLRNISSTIPEFELPAAPYNDVMAR
jgi:hypothetical protein